MAGAISGAGSGGSNSIMSKLKPTIDETNKILESDQEEKPQKEGDDEKLQAGLSGQDKDPSDDQDDKPQGLNLMA
ncbi:MAG: hypothetical protein WC197_04920 [Candidatus Gastranaerophilaceae bacterium]|jgi:hypothetical protein